MTHPLIEQFEDAVREHSMAKSRDPRSFEDIEIYYEYSKIELENLVQEKISKYNQIRNQAFQEYANDDITIAPDAPIEEVDDGYWVTARVWVAK